MNVRKSLTLPTMEYYMTHLSIINTIIPSKMRITPREIDVLACFLTIPTASRFTSHGRKTVMDMLALSKSSMSNHMRALIDKKFIVVSPEDGVTPIDIAPYVLPTPTQEYHIRITHDPSLPDTVPIVPLYTENNNIYGTTNQNQEEKEPITANY